ncbi:transporter substrate-binding domain-containing protein [Desulfovibrio sp. Huiquan2017]|uniref:substrate-binding periplasmic protein n=1 Tax=Desulfovibrio sp. Huiquan2017 TaxID=2816861 RepID=UPI001A912A82|nr:transporter substrate-binding domain-containing protein [Desulfovibrio sp. Huiquan2017]
MKKIYITRLNYYILFVVAWLSITLFGLLPFAEAQPFTFYVDEVPPFISIADKGLISGMAVDVVRELMASVGQPVWQGNIRHINWARAIRTVETTSGTALFALVRTPRREKAFKWVGPIAKLNLGLVAHKPFGAALRGLEDLSNYRIGVVRDSGPSHILASEFGIPEATQVKVKNALIQFRMLRAGRVDLITQADTAVPVILREIGMNPAEFEMACVLKPLELYLAFNPSVDDLLVARLQAELEDMKREDENGVSRYGMIMNRFLEGGATAHHRQ